MSEKIEIKKRTKEETIAYYDGMLTAVNMLLASSGSVGYVRYWRLREYSELIKNLKEDFING